MKGITYKGGETAKKGTYWNIRSGERVNVQQEQVLPGDAKTTYLKGHPIVILLSAPVLGMVYAVFLPFIGIAMAISLVGTKLMSGVAHEVSKAASFGWRPVEAYLSGRKSRKVRKEEEAREKDAQDA